MFAFTQQRKQPPPRASFDSTNSNTSAPAPSRLTHDFGLTPLRAAPPGPQTKLKVSTPGDEYEQEADRVAAQVMRAPDARLQRACACGGDCSKCKSAGQEGEHKHVMRARSNNAAGSVVPSSVDEVLGSPGQPMDSATRAFFEPRFGHDFGRVRVHTDAAASRSAQTLGARAYTVGRHIVFGETFEPHTPSGKSLLAHELVHVIQQGAQESSLGGSSGVGAQGVGASLTSPQVQRQVGDQETAGTGGEGGTQLNANGCYTCDIPGGVGVCCYKDAPFDEGCFNVGKAIIDSCGSSQECLRKAQCATCQCIGQKLGEQYCQCTGIV
ncbi:MAG: DUF4157 domain-containing protein [Pyrinomonadaceae bacterium]